MEGRTGTCRSWMMGGSNPQVKSKEMIAQDSTSAKSTAKSKDESQSPRSKGSGPTVSRATKPPPICDHAPPQELYALKDTGNYLDHQLERKTYEESPLLGQSSINHQYHCQSVKVAWPEAPTMPWRSAGAKLLHLRSAIQKPCFESETFPYFWGQYAATMKSSSHEVMKSPGFCPSLASEMHLLPGPSASVSASATQRAPGRRAQLPTDTQPNPVLRLQNLLGTLTSWPSEPPAGPGKTQALGSHREACNRKGPGTRISQSIRKNDKTPTLNWVSLC